MRFSNSPRRLIRPGWPGLVICLVGMCLTGCSKASPTPTALLLPTPEPLPATETSPAPKPILVSGPATITFAFEQPDLSHYMLLIHEFNQLYPDITIELQPWNWRPTTDGGFVGPDYTADVNVVYSFNPVTSIIRLNSYIEQDSTLNTSDIYPFAQDLFIIGGDAWAIPTGVDFGVLYYDRGLFDTYQVSYPAIGWTRDDFLQTALSLSHPQESIFGYGIGRASLNAYGLYEPFWYVLAHGGRFVDDWNEPSQLVLDDPLTIEALQWYADLIYKHNVAPTPEQAEGYGRSANQPLAGPVDMGFAKGKIGMVLGRFSERGGLYYYGGPGWTRPWGMTTIPQDAAAVTLAMGEGLAISAEAENPEACWAWISFVSQKLPNRTAPARRSLVESAAYDQHVGQEAAAVTRASFEYVWPIPYGYYLVVGNTFQEALDALVNQGITPAEAMQMVRQSTGSP